MYRLFCQKEIFLTFVFYFNVINYTYFYISKSIASYTFCLFLKSLKAFSASLMEVVLFEKLIFNPYFNYNLTGFTKLQLQKSNVRVNQRILDLQRQPPEVFRKISLENPVLNFPVKFPNSLRASILKNFCERLLLDLSKFSFSKRYVKYPILELARSS